jgi:hypothetical protein
MAGEARERPGEKKIQATGDDNHVQGSITFWPTFSRMEEKLASILSSVLTVTEHKNDRFDGNLERIRNPVRGSSRTSCGKKNLRSCRPVDAHMLNTKRWISIFAELSGTRLGGPSTHNHSISKMTIKAFPVKANRMVCKANGVPF